jgi:hypothetical protein
MNLLILHAFSTPWIRISFGAGQLFSVCFSALPDFPLPAATLPLPLPLPPPFKMAARPFWL